MSRVKEALRKISKAKKSGSGKYFNPGKYKLTLDKLFINVGWDDRQTFISELLIRESESTGERKRLKGESPGSETGPEYVPNKAGTIGSFVVGLDNEKAKGSQYSNVKNHVLALDEEKNDIEMDELLDELCSEEGEAKQPLRGKWIELEVFMKPKKSKPDEDFSVHRWTIVKQTPEEMVAERAKLEKQPKDE